MEVTVLKEYKSVKRFINRVELELQKAGLDDLLEVYDEGGKSIKEALLNGDRDTYEESYRDDFCHYSVDTRVPYFIYVYSK